MALRHKKGESIGTITDKNGRVYQLALESRVDQGLGIKVHEFYRDGVNINTAYEEADGSLYSEKEGTAITRKYKSVQDFAKKSSQIMPTLYENIADINEPLPAGGWVA